MELESADSESLCEATSCLAQRVLGEKLENAGVIGITWSFTSAKLAPGYALRIKIATRRFGFNESEYNGRAFE